MFRSVDSATDLVSFAPFKNTKLRPMNKKLHRGLGLCTKRRNNPTDKPCNCYVYKYGMCRYHLGVWKKNNPFLSHP